MDHWILAEDGKTPIKTDLPTWVRWVEKNDRKVAFDRFGDVKVSTVFLTLDHAFRGGEPVLWETMILGGPCDQEQWRATSHEQALKNHAEAVEMVRDKAL